MSIYRQFCHEITDENGKLKKLTTDIPDNFNFGYDVVDKIANCKVGMNDKPMFDVTIETIEIIEI